MFTITISTPYITLSEISQLFGAYKNPLVPKVQDQYERFFVCTDQWSRMAGILTQQQPERHPCRRDGPWEDDTNNCFAVVFD